MFSIFKTQEKTSVSIVTWVRWCTMDLIIRLCIRFVQLLFLYNIYIRTCKCVHILKILSDESNYFVKMTWNIYNHATYFVSCPQKRLKIADNGINVSLSPNHKVWKWIEITRRVPYTFSKIDIGTHIVTC